MDISGHLLIGGGNRAGAGESLWALNAATGERLEPAFGSAMPADVDEACALAWAAFDGFRARPRDDRARLLEAVAEEIAGLGDVLIERCMAETGLPRARLEGERNRTAGQLRLFADVVRDCGFLDIRIDPGQPDRQPAPRPDLRLRRIPLGPVAIFGASNFPLAFSVAGGDTASALAAGCPVIVKAHPAHPGTSELIGRAIQRAVSACAMPTGVFSLLHARGFDVGQKLASDPRVKAVGFTGSRTGGVALMHAAAARPDPIPVYAEMSSINPVILFPHALAERAEEIGAAFVTSLTLGAGQFCTNPGLIIAVEGPSLERFLAGVREALAAAQPQVMLTPDLCRTYRDGLERLGVHPALTLVGGVRADQGRQGGAAVFATAAGEFLKYPALQEEVFGAASILVRCADERDFSSILEALEGQLTASLHLADADLPTASRLLPLLERKVGRILANGFGTGVEVSPAMVHGGPYPATSDSRTTSVGSLAIDRFLRPVCYQNLPVELLPPELRQMPGPV